MSIQAKNHSPFVFCILQYVGQALYDNTLYMNAMFRGKQCLQFHISNDYNTDRQTWGWGVSFPYTTDVPSEYEDRMYFENYGSTIDDNHQTIDIRVCTGWPNYTRYPFTTSINAVLTTYDGSGYPHMWGDQVPGYAYKDGRIVIPYLDGYEITAYIIGDPLESIVIEKSVDGTKPNMQYMINWSSELQGCYIEDLMMIPENKVIYNYYDIDIRDRNDNSVDSRPWCTGKPINLSYFHVVGRFDADYNVEDITRRSVFDPPNGTVFDEVGSQTVAVTAYDLEGDSYSTSFDYNVDYTIDSLNVAYDNTESGLEADNLQDAITECRELSVRIFSLIRKKKVLPK